MLAKVETIENQRVKYYLELWSEWHKDDHAEIKQLTGNKSQCMSFIQPGAHTFEDMAETAESRAAVIVDSIIEDIQLMPSHQKLAIHHFHLAAVWKPARYDIEDCYQDALESLERGLNLKGLA